MVSDHPIFCRRRPRGAFRRWPSSLWRISLPPCLIAIGDVKIDRRKNRAVILLIIGVTETPGRPLKTGVPEIVNLMTAAGAIMVVICLFNFTENYDHFSAI